jgi:hypothetical protein
MPTLRDSAAREAVLERVRRLTPSEWSLLAWKHRDHHLRQFGV